MQSTPTLKDTDPHDVFAIESLLAAHAEKTPPLAHDPAAPSVESQIHVAPPISASAAIPQLEPTFGAPDAGDIQVENVRPGEIKVDGLKPLGEPATAKWVKRVVMGLLGLCGAMAAAAWQHYGDQAKAVAAEWAPPFVLAALPSATTPPVAEQPNAPATGAATTTDQAVAQPAAAATPAQPNPTAATATAAAAPSAESSQMQSMAQDLATMGQQVEELKAAIAQLKAGQAQMARELAKTSEAKAGETRPAEQTLRPRVSALTPPPQRPAAPPPVRKPKPAAYSYSPAPVATAPIAAAPAAPLPPAQAAAPLSPAPPRQTIADDGEPVVRPPMPLR